MAKAWIVTVINREQVAKQYLSHSLGMLDNILFALAPLGIITAIIAAIRVGGPMWLKALVGRARENIAQTELELMSSTSHEVGEAWNGNAIVRTLGQPKVSQIIYLEGTTEDGDECGLYTVELAEKAGYLRCDSYEQFRHSGNSEEPERARLADPENSDDGPVAQGESPATSANAAPNISLNLHNGSSRAELLLATIVGVVVQLSVVAFAAATAYHPTWKLQFQEDGRPTPDYAFPLLASGTLLLFIGLWICTTVIDMSTDEWIWRRTKPSAPTKNLAPDSSEDAVPLETLKQDNKSFKAAHVMWLQQHHTVSDQAFKSTIIAANSPREKLLASRRGAAYKKLRFLAVTEVTFEWFCAVGAVVSLTGFVCQFQGLRGMNWTVSLAQLTAMGAMTAIRAWIRRGLAVAPLSHELPEGGELHSIAMDAALNGHWNRRNSGAGSRRQGMSNRNASPPVTDSIAAQPHIRIILDDKDGAYEGFFSKGKPVRNDKDVAQTAVRIRKRLSELVEWDEPDESDRHAFVCQKVLNIKDTCGWTPLHFAAFYGQEAMVAFLLEEGANPTMKDNVERTALNRAIDGYRSREGDRRSRIWFQQENECLGKPGCNHSEEGTSMEWENSEDSDSGSDSSSNSNSKPPHAIPTRTVCVEMDKKITNSIIHRLTNVLPLQIKIPMLEKNPHKDLEPPEVEGDAREWQEKERGCDEDSLRVLHYWTDPARLELAPLHVSLPEQQSGPEPTSTSQAWLNLVLNPVDG
ncbi:hypothetical protein BJ508DRAFT_333003 [Ascobolus immersus RN42]|uniref:Uncharacterized protein n=1 Tax=Ascobolus immersus RN42 TaxID=1160509 RepID=A0A3N4HKZ9_ASCIM|nr:hypothetical protein BJ508DRAFT_333003 [Ascobolus immersus RN42]